MKAVASVLLALLTISACSAEAPSTWWKRGGTFAELQRDAFDCERETRAAAHTFSRGSFRDAEASAYAGRCMTAKGYVLVRYSDSTTAPVTPVLEASPMADDTGRQYRDADKVDCRFRTVSSVEMTARTCSQGGGIILGPAGASR